MKVLAGLSGVNGFQHHTLVKSERMVLKAVTY